MASTREIQQGTQEQGTEEEIIYTLTVPASWGTPTGTPVVKAYSVSQTSGGGYSYTDVTSTIFPSGSASIAGQVITLPLCKSMTEATLYRVEIKFSTSEGDVKEPYAMIECKR